MNRNSRLKTYKPLKRGKSRLKGCWIKRGTKPLRYRSPKQQAKQAEWNEITKENIKACGGKCMATFSPRCTGKATEGHHIRPRSHRGPNTRENNLPVCHACGQYIHRHPIEAAKRGLLILPKYDAAVAVGVMK